jgi:peptide deformylase
VERAKKIKVKYTDINGKEKIKTLEGLNARIVQHEVDHLD